MISVMDRIVRAARKAGRDPAEITLVVASKTREPKELRKAISQGARVFGENYVQEAEEKKKKVRDKSVKWHLIGHLQKNKVKKAVEIFDVIESVDSLKLAELINKRTPEPIDVLIEINIAGEETKHGVDIKDAVKLARGISKLENLNLRGIMAIPPEMETPEESRPYFITLRRLAERINKQVPGAMLRDLSMGMSADFEVAIEEGATIVRVGTAIFGPRAEKKPAKKAAKKPAKKPEKKPAAKKKTTTKKAAEKKKPAAKKKTTKKAAKAAPKKKAAAKKTTAKKKTTKAAPKKKAAAKKSTAKKTTGKKTTAKKPAAKKTTKAAPKKKSTAKKATTKKTTAKKTTAKKTTAKKSAAKPAKKKASTKTKGGKSGKTGKKTESKTGKTSKKAGTSKKASKTSSKSTGKRKKKS